MKNFNTSIARIYFLVIMLLGSFQIIYGQNTKQSVLANPVSHSLFIAGPKFTGIIGEKGEEIWNSGKDGARDGYVLANGNILICWGDEVKEFDKNRAVIFTYKKRMPENELGTALRLTNGNTLITESGKEPAIIEVDSKGAIVSSTTLQPETDNTHMQTRMARKLANGNYLVPHLLAFSVKEYTPAGKVVKEFKTDIPALGGRAKENWPFTAIRLKNGHTLVTLTHGNKVVEFDKTGKIVWEVSNDDLEEKPFNDPCGAQRLPNGNTVIASYGASYTEGESIKIFELTADKKIVWTYKGYGAHGIQVLTTNGIPIMGAPLK